MFYPPKSASDRPDIRGTSTTFYFTKLQSDPDFRADVEAAKAEVAAARAKGLKPDRDCAAEAAQLAAG